MGHLKFCLPVFVILYVSEEAANASENFENKVKQQSTTIVDKILQAYKHAVIDSGNVEGEIMLDDIKINISIPLFENQVKIWATNGRLRNVLTLQRTSPVELDYVRKPGAIILRSAFKLDVSQIYFKNFQVDFPLVHQVGSIEVDVRGVTIYIEVVMDEYPCKAYLNEMKILSFGDVKPNIKGMSWSILEAATERIVKAFLQILSSTSKATLEKYFYKQVQDALEFIDICGTLFI